MASPMGVSPTGRPILRVERLVATRTHAIRGPEGPLCNAQEQEDDADGGSGVERLQDAVEAEDVACDRKCQAERNEDRRTQPRVRATASRENAIHHGWLERLVPFDGKPKRLV